MWGFAHLVDLPGASFVTLGLQKSKGVANEHNVARAFNKPRRLHALVRVTDPSIALIASISP
jgi:hypothetical protein